jgi:predicted SAM-dependent methyltransferase
MMKKAVKLFLAKLLGWHRLRSMLVNVLSQEGWVSRVRTSPLPSETSVHRPNLSPYCTGNGIDLGFGGDPINESAVRIDLPSPYSEGLFPTQLAGDASRLHWFADSVLDYVFSSHLLEDFPHTADVLREWLRVLKPGGLLVIGCPDEAKYRAYCAATNHPRNEHHVHADFSLSFVTRHLESIGSTTLVYQNDAVGPYSWEIVVRKNG